MRRSGHRHEGLRPKNGKRRQPEPFFSSFSSIFPSFIVFMSEVPQQFSVLPQLPAVIPPTSRLNFLKNWWQRSDKTSAIAEARLLHRISQSTLSLKAPVPIVANLLRVPLDDNEPPNTKSARLVNTLHLKAAPDQKAPFVLNTEENDIESIKDKGDSKNLVICHGYGAGKQCSIFFREKV